MLIIHLFYSNFLLFISSTFFLTGKQNKPFKLQVQVNVRKLGSELLESKCHKRGIMKELPLDL